MNRAADGPAGAWTKGVALAAVVVLALGLVHVAWMAFCYDDAFVSFRYAANLVHGHGLVYNPGQRVEGYTNFLWTVLMALVLEIGGRPETWSLILGGAFALAGLAFVMHVAVRRGIDPILAGVLLAGSSAWAAWATGGLETGMFSAFVAAGVLRLLMPERTASDAPAAIEPRVLALSGLALGLAALTRPEGLLVAACAGAWLLWRAAARELTPHGLVLWAGAIALCVVPHVAWRLAYYGHLTPNTFAVKEPAPAYLGNGLRYLADAVCDLRLWLLAIPIVLVPLARRAPPTLGGRGWALLGMVVVPYAAYVATTGGDFMPLYRFVAPLLPLVAFAAAAALTALVRAAPARMAARAAAWTLAIAFVALNLAGSLRQQGVWSKGEMVSVGWSRQEVNEWLRIGDLLKLVAQPTDTLAVTGAGAVPYRSGLPTIDLHGLNAPDLSHYRRRTDTQRPGHMLMLEGRWLDADPPQILLGHPLVHPTPATLTVGIDLEPQWRPRVMSHYELVGMKLEGEPVRYVGCAIRRDVANRIIAASLERARTP